MVADLPPSQLTLVRSYLSHRFPGSPELVTCFDQIAERFPTHLRVKELFETIEACHITANYLAELLKSREHPIKTVFDVACGHGLLGVLIAYRFPKIQVVCVDKQQREAYTNYVTVVSELGEKAEGEEKCLSNLGHMEGDLTAIPYDKDTYVVCIHGCNEATKLALEHARSAQAAWAVVPCCIRDELYDAQRIKCGKDDDLRHAFSCGVIAATYGACKSLTIDRGITNRNIVILGDGLE